jgi:hypothetical protein
MNCYQNPNLIFDYPIGNDMGRVRNDKLAGSFNAPSAAEHREFNKSIDRGCDRCTRAAAFGLSRAMNSRIASRSLSAEARQMISMMRQDFFGAGRGNS